KNLFTFVDVRGGASDSATAGLKRALAGFPDVKVRTRDDWVANRAHGVDQLLQFLYVLLALSVIVSLFGMVNTLVLSVFERTRELGMLRAIGMTRRQVRRMIRHESVITALIGAGLGLPLGLFLAALVTQGLSSQGVGFHVPVLTLEIFAFVAIVAGVVAAVVPAREADVSDPEAVGVAFARVDALLGGLDVLVSNAGISIRRRFLESSADEWRRVLAVSLEGVFACAQHAARRMGDGGVILVT